MSLSLSLSVSVSERGGGGGGGARAGNRLTRLDSSHLTLSCSPLLCPALLGTTPGTKHEVSKVK